jgi:hypothetical protein
MNHVFLRATDAVGGGSPAPDVDWSWMAPERQPIQAVDLRREVEDELRSRSEPVAVDGLR